jgi:hypothetical protein
MAIGRNAGGVVLRGMNGRHYRSILFWSCTNSVRGCAD